MTRAERIAKLKELEVEARALPWTAHQADEWISYLRNHALAIIEEQEKLVKLGGHYVSGLQAADKKLAEQAARIEELEAENESVRKDRRDVADRLEVAQTNYINTRAENEKLRGKIAEFIDGERCGPYD